MTPEVIVTGAALLLTLLSWLLDRYRTLRKRITYRIRTNTSLRVAPEMDAHEEFEIHRESQRLENPSIVVIRIGNTGGVDVNDTDMETPPNFDFPGRQVVGVGINTADPEDLRRVIEDRGGFALERSRVSSPAFPMNRKDAIEFRVILTGEGTEVNGHGFIRGGRFVIDNTPSVGQRPLSRTTAWVSISSATLAVFLVFLGLSVGLFGSSTAGTGDCVAGQLVFTGSTAFQPAAEQIAKAYSDGCRAARVSAVGGGSNEELRELHDNGARDSSVAGGTIVASDVLAPAQYNSLIAHPVAVVPFSIIVNRSTTVSSLTLGQVQAIYSGAVTNWRDVGGADQPVLIVGRGSDSGTRTTFESKVLGGRSEPPVSSDSCRQKDRPGQQGSTTVRCEVKDTQTMLDTVDAIGGTIGYAQAATAADKANVKQVQIDGADPDADAVRYNRYPFWAVERLYTFGTPAPGTLADALLAYTEGDVGQNSVRKSGLFPCSDFRGVCT